MRGTCLSHGHPSSQAPCPQLCLQLYPHAYTPAVSHTTPLCRFPHQWDGPSPAVEPWGGCDPHRRDFGAEALHHGLCLAHTPPLWPGPDTHSTTRHSTHRSIVSSSMCSDIHCFTYTTTSSITCRICAAYRALSPEQCVSAPMPALYGRSCGRGCAPMPSMCSRALHRHAHVSSLHGDVLPRGALHRQAVPQVVCRSWQGRAVFPVQQSM